MIFEVLRCAMTQHPLDGPHRERGVGGDLSGERHRGVSEVIVVDDLVDQAEFAVPTSRGSSLLPESGGTWPRAA